MASNNPRIPPTSPRVIEVLAFEDVQMLDLAGSTQVFATVNEIAAKAGAAPLYEVRVISPGGGQVRATSGLSFAASPLSVAGEMLDTLVVVGGQGVMRAAEDSRLVDWLRERIGVARRTASVCTGAFLLAATGLLDGRRAVTHWEYCDRLARRHPLVSVDPDPIFIRDGGIWTSAGVTAGIDLCLALVEEDVGRSLALAAARNLVVFLKRPGGQAQYSDALSLQTSDDRFGDLHAWLADHLAHDLSLRQLAKHASMSERTFLRRYREATGLTPQRAVERLRVEAARQMLLGSHLPTKRIADRCGFGSEETMRRSFVRLQGVTPGAYRERFGE